MQIRWRNGLLELAFQLRVHLLCVCWPSPWVSDYKTQKKHPPACIKDLDEAHKKCRRRRDTPAEIRAILRPQKECIRTPTVFLRLHAGSFPADQARCRRC